jgi:hypothetical protein
VNSCVKDFSHWLMMQLDSGKYNGKEVVSFAALQETRTPQMIMPPPSTLFPGMHFQSYALGWYTADFYGKKIIWHNGGAGGFLSTTCFVPELDLGFVVLTNSDNNALYNALRYQLLDAYLGLPYRNYSTLYFNATAKAEKQEEAQLSQWRAKANQHPQLPVDAKSFAGTYINPLYGKMNVTVENGKIGATFEHHAKMFAQLEYTGENTFLCTYNSPLWGITQAPFKIKNGKVESITISVADFVDRMTYEFVKQ